MINLADYFEFIGSNLLLLGFNFLEWMFNWFDDHDSFLTFVVTLAAIPLAGFPLIFIGAILFACAALASLPILMVNLTYQIFTGNRR